MRIQVKKTEKYIPEWNGNREDSDPITVHYRFLSESERGKYVEIEPVKVTGDGEPVVSIRQDNKGLALAMVTRIENLVVEMNGISETIDDAKKLYGFAGIPSALVKEIEGVLYSASAVVDTTPLEPPTTSTD